MDAVILENVTFNYLGAKEPALRNLNLRIKQGEIVGIFGPIGAGKTSLLRCLNGLIPYEFPGELKGRIIVDGLDVREHTINELVRHVGIVLSDPTAQIFSLSVFDDVSFGPLNMGLPPEKIEERVKWALKVTGLDGLEFRNPRELSGGQQQRLAIAGLLAMRPKILALDEPISMLDPIGKRSVLSAIQELRDKHGLTCIITESGTDLESVIGILDRVVLIDKGRVLLDDSPANAFTYNYEIFDKIGVGLPELVKIFAECIKQEENIHIPLTIDEAAELLEKFLEKFPVEYYRGKKEASKYASISREIQDNHIRRRPVISVRNLTFVYPNGVKALDNVNLDIYEGEMVGLIGQNGSGKTTLALNLVGVLKPTNPDAKIIVNGIDVVKSQVEDLCSHINYVFQNPDHQLFSKNVVEELSFGLKMKGLATSDIKERISEVLKTLDLEGHENDMIINLTKDLKTLVAIASLLVLKPKVLIVDEPTNGLDYQGAIHVMNVLSELRREGHTIIVIMHHMKLIAKYCDRVIVMKDGKILLDGPVHEVFMHEKELEEAALTPPPTVLLARKIKAIPDNVLTPEVVIPIIKEMMGEA